jgi:hypothetical protein
LCKGFSNSQGKVKGALVSREKGAHSSRGTFLKEPIAKLERILQGVQVPLYLSSLLYFLLEALHIYTSISNWFSPGGFVQGHVDNFSCMLSFISTAK